MSQIDVADKTISVPPGGAGLTGKIKSLLTEAGWHISVYQGPVATEGTVVDDKVRLSTERTFKSRYNLMIRWQQFDVCLDNMQPAISYDISLIDNKSGAEVMTMSGRDCETLVARKFVEQLQ
jgi:hypothetical protein